MQQYNLYLGRCLARLAHFFSSFHPHRRVALVLFAGVIACGGGWVNAQEAQQELSEEAIKAQREKIDVLLDVAQAHISDKKTYQLALDSLAQIDEFKAAAKSSQLKRAQKLHRQAREGSEAQRQAKALLVQGDEALNRKEYGQAEEAYDQAYDLRKFLPQPTVEKIRLNRKQVREGVKAYESEVVALYRASIAQYKDGQLAEAEVGFRKVQDSGVQLGFFRTGTRGSAEGYLKKIAKAREVQAKEAAKAQETAARQAESKREDRETPSGPDRSRRQNPARDQERLAAQAREQQLRLVAQQGDRETAGQQAELARVFARSKTHFDAGRMDEAEAGFLLVDESDVKLTLEERGGQRRDAGDYLKEIARIRQRTAEQQMDRIRSDQTQPDPKRSSKQWNLFSRKPKLDEDDRREIERLLINGRKAFKAGNFAQAKTFYHQVLSLDPENAEALQGASAADYQLEMGSSLPEEKPVASILDKVKAREEVQVQSIEASVISTRQRVYDLVAQEAFDDATAQVNVLLTNIENARALLGAERYGAIKAECMRLLSDVDKKRDEATLRQQEMARERARQEEQTRIRRVEGARQQKINNLMQKARDFRDDQDYDLAVKALDELLAIDPKNRDAKYMREDMATMQFMMKQLDIRRTSRFEENRVLIDARESSIPWADLINFPADWVEKSERRLEATEMFGNPLDQALYERMATERTELSYIETSLQQVLSDFQLEHNLNMNVLWGSLELYGINRDDPVTLQLTEVTLDTALASILEYVSSGNPEPATYDIRNGVIRIAADIDLEPELYSEIYYIADLVQERSEAFQGALGIGQNNQQFSGGGQGISAGGSNVLGGQVGNQFQGTQQSGQGGNQQGGDTFQTVFERIDDVIFLIQTSVGFDQWDIDSLNRQGSGGGQGGSNQNITLDEEEIEVQGTIEVFQTNQLVVSQTARNHRVIRAVLDRLRERIGEQVSIEIRFLLITSNFLEDIGVDIDFFLNLGNASFDQTGTIDPVTGRQILTPRAEPGASTRWTPIAATQNSFEAAIPDATGVPGSFGGQGIRAFTLSGSFLDNIQVDFLIRATQAHRRSRQGEAPLVTIHNGEQAQVNFQVNQSYVASLQAVTDNRVGLFNPVVAQAPTGVSMVLTPTISADRRYVSMNVEVIQTNVLSFQTFTFNVAAGAAPAEVGDDGGDTIDTVGASTVSTGTIQQPTLEVNQIQTHVTVPDGGTLLLGGQKVTAEIEKEVGVPGLSKIPVIKRLFDNRSRVMDESILLILLKPTIILKTEEEQLRFGSLIDYGGETN